MFLGYTLLLLVDKVMFDAHAYFDELDGHEHADPAIRKMSDTIKESISKSEQLAAEGDIVGSNEVLKQGQQATVKNYLNCHEQFAARLKSSVDKAKSPGNKSPTNENEDGLLDKKTDQEIAL